MTTDSLGLVFYSSKQQSWGFQFRVPKFQGFDSLHVVCEVYVCNPETESKLYCDRSCLDPGVLQVSGTAPPLLRNTRQPDSRRSRRASRGNIRRRLIGSRILMVQDTGYGPLIDENGRLLAIDSLEGKHVGHSIYVFDLPPFLRYFVPIFLRTVTQFYCSCHGFQSSKIEMSSYGSLACGSVLTRVNVFMSVRSQSRRNR
jgi:hypothetical protein